MKQRGFTLIELVVVIVILGILAVTAAPRFLNLQSDSRTAALEGMKGSIEGAIGVAYGKLALAGWESEEVVTTYDEKYEEIKEWCQDCAFSYGYPSNLQLYTLENLVDGLKYGPTATEFRIGGQQSDEDHQLAISFAKSFDENQWLTSDDCYIRYTPPTKTEQTYKLEVIPCK